MSEREKERKKERREAVRGTTVGRRWKWRRSRSERNASKEKRSAAERSARAFSLALTQRRRAMHLSWRTHCETGSASRTDAHARLFTFSWTTHARLFRARTLVSRANVTHPHFRQIRVFSVSRSFSSSFHVPFVVFVENGKRIEHTLYYRVVGGRVKRKGIYSISGMGYRSNLLRPHE